MTHIQSQIAKVLGLASPESITPRQRLFDLGIDSLMAVELKSRLETSLSCSLRTTLIFDYPTVEALVNYLGQEVLALETIESSNAPVNKQTNDLENDLATVAAELEELSESEAEALLLEELEKMNRLTMN